jgi:hypothetical protein
VSTPPDPVRIYHITHVDNLASIIAAGHLLSDAEMIARGGPGVAVGMSSIKQRRLGLPVKCLPGTMVGQYVPFYFCPRSIMLYLLHMGNHPELTYRGGQGPIVHLEAEIVPSCDWADAEGLRWAFTLSNAGAVYTEFRNNLSDLADVDWQSVAATDFRSSSVKEGKQAEFLVEQRYAWTLIQRIGVRNASMRARVLEELAAAPHQPSVDVLPRWYF